MACSSNVPSTSTTSAYPLSPRCSSEGVVRRAHMFAVHLFASTRSPGFA
eukprot:CAMPEP_0198716470 /NCGR_PEP_ID=MMETSP1471-20131121/38404_1 /TAXON_ID=41880 /ORGANISM="Pycnococcus provasolii, Strain RCC733" /LENGTH=48 /DNA_ID= /DNA_START= /DNA_END= /DNA_ORIENTATION=